MSALIDANTGRVTWSPHTICCWDNDVPEGFRPIEFRAGSNLIVFRDMRNETEADARAHYYKVERGKFIYLGSIKGPLQ